MQNLIQQMRKTNKNVLILGAPRSGTHALASLFVQQKLGDEYLGEICMLKKNSEPWLDINPMLSINTRKIAHIVQSYSKLFLISQILEIKKTCFIVEIRRRNKLDQFASWIYFRHIGAIYDFSHADQDYLPPKSINITLDDIEQFLIDQTIDRSFCADVIVYYEEIDFSNSRIKKNQYKYPIRQVINNFDLAEKYLSLWQYYDKPSAV